MIKEKKLERWAEQELIRNIDLLILNDEHGNILAFGIYDIRPCTDLVEVYQKQVLIGKFSNRKIALSWCVAHHKKLHELGQHIKSLDQRCRALRDDIAFSRSGERLSQNNNSRDLLRAKIQNKEWFIKMLDYELEKCVARAKYLQLRGFNNETATTGIS